MAKFIVVENSPGQYLFQCPGCNCSHSVYVAPYKGPNWTFNGDVDKPTCSPSLRVRFHRVDPDIEKLCHSYIKDGNIQFLSDCTHSLAGQTVELPEWES